MPNFQKKNISQIHLRAGKRKNSEKKEKKLKYIFKILHTYVKFVTQIYIVIIYYYRVNDTQNT